MTLRNMKLIQTIKFKPTNGPNFMTIKIILQNTKSYMFWPHWFTIRQHKII